MWLQPGRQSTRSTRRVFAGAEMRRNSTLVPVPVSISCRFKGADLGGADNMRGQHENDFVVLHLMLGGAEDVLQDRKLSQKRRSANGGEILLLQESAQYVDFAFLEADHLLGRASG